MGQIALWKVGIYWTKYEWVCLVDTCMSKCLDSLYINQKEEFLPAHALSHLTGDVWHRSDGCLSGDVCSLLCLESPDDSNYIANISRENESRAYHLPLYRKKGRSRHPMVSVPAFEINLSGLNITQRGWLQQDEQFYFAQFVHSFLQMDWEEEKETNADSTDTY